MKPFLMLPFRWSNLIWFSISILYFSSCSPKLVPENAVPEPFLNDTDSSLIYNAELDYKDFHVSGIMVVKKLTEAYHVVLLSKFGVTIMEFQLNMEGITWIKSFEQLEKKSAEKLIEKDFRVLLLTPLLSPKKVILKKENEEYDVLKVKNHQNIEIFVSKTNNHILYAESKGFLNPVKTKVKFTYLDKEVPQNISLSHTNVKLNIELNLLEEDNAEE